MKRLLQCYSYIVISGLRVLTAIEMMKLSNF